MNFEFTELVCNIFYSFRVGDDASYNAQILCDLVEANERGKFNKPILLQAASLIEVAAMEIFKRAKYHTKEGVPNVSKEDQKKIEDKKIDKFAVAIDNLQKYQILDRMGANIYDDLHKLREYRNKIHIQSKVKIQCVDEKEDRLFTDETTIWAVDLNWRVLSHLVENYSRPEAFKDAVKPLRLPKLV